MTKAIFITVRTGSSRLTSKSILKIQGKHTIQYVIDSVKKSQHADKIVLCTTEKSEDNVLAVIAADSGIDCFRGSELDKFKRWTDAAEKFNIDFFVTADGDDLFYDAGLADLVFQQYERTNVDFINGQGLYVDVYGIKASALREIVKWIPKLWPHIKEIEPFELDNYINDIQLSHWVANSDLRYRTVKLKNVPDIYKKKKIRMTLDYDDDLKFFNTVITNLPKDFILQDVLQYLENNKEVVDINFHRETDWKQNQLNHSNIKLDKETELETKIDKIDNLYNKYNGNELNYILDILDSENVERKANPYVNRFEDKFASIFQSKYAIAHNSGTSTLHSCLIAAGIQPDDEVISPAHTVIMNSFVTLFTGAIPVYVDIDPDTFNMCPRDLENKITDKTKAIQVVHMHGNPSDMVEIMKVSKKYNIPVIEDSAQCVMGYIDNKLVGTFGDMSSWSFETKKHLSTGEGGMVTTDNEQYATMIRKTGGLGYKTLEAGQSLRQLLPEDFQNPHYKRHDTLGWNYRMNELTAAVGLAQLERVDFLVSRRQQIARMYDILFDKYDFIVPQKVLPGHINTYWTYTVKYEGSDWFGLYNDVKANGGDGFYGGLSVPYQEPVMTGRRYINEGCPNAERVQPKLMQFKTNYRDLEAAEKKIKILGSCLDGH
jgi:perosamine synthetase